MNLSNRYPSIFECIKEGEKMLQQVHKADASIDAKLLMRHILDYDETQLLLNRHKPIDAVCESKYYTLIKKRAQGIPLQYLTGYQEFMGLTLSVNEDVLIPRQDTESLVEELINQSQMTPFKRGIDIGTGSGCISIALAYYIKDLKMTAIDISEEALVVANQNIRQYQLENRICCLNSNLFEAYTEREKVDLIVSNPPYISREEAEGLMVEVIEHEPRRALTDEEDGLTFYKAISKEAKAYLKDGGTLAYEIGYNQAQDVVTILEKEGYSQIQLFKDLAQKDRIVIAKWSR